MPAVAGVANRDDRTRERFAGDGVRGAAGDEEFVPFSFAIYPLVIQHNCGKSSFLLGKLTINGHSQ